MKKLLYILTLAVGLASCDSGEYVDWADPMSNAQEDAKTVTMSVASVDLIDYNYVTDDSVQLFVPTVSSTTETTTSYTVTLADTDNSATQELTADANGYVDADELSSAVANIYGKRPETRTLNLTIVSLTNDNGVSIKNVGTTTATVLLVAPEIASAYYIIGPNDWSTSEARSQAFTHSDQDVYDDPEFTVIFAAASSGDTWFAIADDAALDAIDAGDWNQLYGCTNGGGDNTGTSGSLDRRSNLGGDNSFKVASGPSYIKVTINMMDCTYEIQELNFSSYIYEIGNSSGWATSEPLYSANLDGSYLGFAYLNGEYKFKPNADDWDGDYGQDPNGATGTLVQEGENNCGPADAGYYAISVNLVDLTYSTTLISSISLIGSAVNGDSSWSTDYDMTYDSSSNTWTFTGDLTAGEFKFRANHAWDYNWGGTTDNLVQNGANISVSEAGTYTISLSALCDTKATYTITKQ